MNEYDKFEKIYDSNGVPITLFEIEEWWDNCNTEQRRLFKSPDEGDSARYAISQQIVNEMANRNNKEQLDIIKKFKSHHIDVRNKIAENIQINSILNRRPTYTQLHYVPVYNEPNRNSVIYNRPPDLEPIPGYDHTSHYGPDSIFQKAMHMAEEKARQEEYASKYSNNRSQSAPPPQEPPQEPPKPIKTWKTVFGIPEKALITKEQMIKIFRTKAMIAHPDKGGSKEDMHALIEARNNALKELS